MKRLVAAIAVYALITNVSISAAENAGRESAFGLGAGARALGMGNAFTAVGGDPSVIFYNPSLISTLDWQEVSLMHTTLFEGTQYNFASYAVPSTRWGGFGIAFMRLGTGDIIKTQQYAEVGTFSYSDVQVMVSYGKAITHGVSLGSSLKFVQQSIDIYSDNGFGLDVGASWRITDWLNTAFVVRDLLPARIKLRSKQEIIPITFVGGLAVQKEIYPGKLRLGASIDLEKIEGHQTRFHAGTESLIDSVVAVRIGYDHNNLTAGAGFRYQRLKFDYAYRPIDYVDDSHRFTLSLMLGTSVQERLSKEKKAEESRGSAIIEGDRQRQFIANKEIGDQMYRNFQLDSAQTYYERALAFDPENANVIGTIAAVREAIEVRQSRELQVSRMARDREISIISYYDQAKSFFERRYYPAAIEVLGKLIELDPNNSDALQLRHETEAAMSSEIAISLSRAQASASEGQYLKAIEHYTRILELDPANDAVRQARLSIESRLEISQKVNTAIDLYKLGQYSDSRRIFLEVLQIDNAHALASEYVRRIDRAIAAPPVLQAIENDKEIWPLYLEGLRLMREKQYLKAIEMWERVLDVYPNNPNTLDNIRQARLRLESEPK
jgi:tetratricopeptide (TPR) repeat protein